MQSIGTRRATKETLTAVVAVKGIQAKYLALEETGGTRVPSMNTRKPSAKALVLPGKAIPLDSFGNIPSGLVGRLMQRAKAQQAAAHAGKRRRNGQQDTGLVYMSGSNPNNQRGLGGLFKRMAGHHLMRLIAFEPSESYRPRFGFHDRIAKIVLATFVERLKARFQEALATARR